MICLHVQSNAAFNLVMQEAILMTSIPEITGFQHQ